jgi:hypothetical protein
METACGFVSVAVEGWDCLILRFVSLPSMLLQQNSPVQIGGLYVAESLWLTAAQQDHICRYKVVRIQSYDIPYTDIPPRSRYKLLIHKYLGLVIVQRPILSMPFLSLADSAAHEPSLP